jgi:hypothetical protein
MSGISSDLFARPAATTALSQHKPMPTAWSPLVHRAPDERFKALVPYRLVLVDMQDGMRVMGHAQASLQIGDQVRCEIHTLAGQPLPFFTRTDHEA